jgi:hypothetical protein
LQRVRLLEVNALVDRHVGVERWVTRDDILGHGAGHAFGSTYGRLRFVESLETGDAPEGAPAPAPEVFDQLMLDGPAWEWLQLVGTQELVESAGVDRTPEHRYGDRYVNDELALRRELEGDPQRRRRLSDIVVTQELINLTEEINRACLDRGIDPLGLFLMNSAHDDPPAAMRAFVAGLPSINVVSTLRFWKHRDRNHPWEQHDKSDIMALMTAIPYCDAVVTERRWVHLVRASGLASTYSTAVGFGLSALEHVVRQSATA